MLISGNSYDPYNKYYDNHSYGMCITIKIYIYSLCHNEIFKFSLLLTPTILYY